MSAGFTPGPWEIQKPNSDDKRRIIAPNQSGFDVCRMVRSANDARLIAAAPELYAQLEFAAKALREARFVESAIVCEATLAKARGETA